MLAKSDPSFLMSNKYHNFTAKELDEMQRIFELRCMQNPQIAIEKQRKLEVAREVVTSYDPKLSETAVAMLSLSMII